MGVKMTDIEIFYIKNNPDNLSDKELAKKVGRSVTAVKRILAEKKVEPVVQASEPEPEPVVPNKPRGLAQKAMGHLRKNGHSLATVMTEAASQIADESRKSGKHKKSFNEQFKDCVYRPYSDDDGE